MNDIKPFRIEIEDAALNDLRRRLAETRWPDESPAEGRERGIRLAEVRELAEYWADGFDWRAEEASLNTIPQFTADVNGQRIHFFHARTEQADAPVILLAHGYPSSNVEFPRLIELLTDSRS